MDWADKWTRDVLSDYRNGSQINGGCVEIYAAVSTALRDAFAQGAARVAKPAPRKNAKTPTV